jgi:hypothetical protein
MVTYVFQNQTLYSGSRNYSNKMAEYKSREDRGFINSTDVQDIYNTMKQNYIKTIDEMAKMQPQCSQSISNLQLDYIQTIKNLVQNTISSQKQIAENANWNMVTATPYTEQFTRQSNEMTNNAIRAVNINNQLTINTLDAARDNLKIYDRTIDSFTEFNTNVAKAWASFFSVQQQHFFKH